MTLANSIGVLQTILQSLQTPLPNDIEEAIVKHIQSSANILTEYIASSATRVKKDRKCQKCNTTNPENFNRKKTECIQCMSKASYEKIKVRLESGKERNILARLERKECSVCKLVVERTNAQMFDWDHRNPSEKQYAISKMNYKEDGLFFEEIAKCDLTCRNCHMMRTMRQFQQNVITKRMSNTNAL